MITQLTDFRMQSQLLRVLIPGEQELHGQPKVHVGCDSCSQSYVKIKAPDKSGSE